MRLPLQAAVLSPRLLTLFFLASAVVCVVAAASFTSLFVTTAVIWRAKPQAFLFLSRFPIISVVGFLLLASIFAACAGGLYRRRAWGYRLAIVLICANALSAFVNLAGKPTYAGLVGIVIVSALIWWLTRPYVRAQFVEDPC